MNTKFILIFFVMLNLLSITFSLFAGQDIGIYSDAMGTFFDYEAANGEINITSYNADLNEGLAGLSESEQGVISKVVGGVFDVFKIIASVISILTPFPIFAIMNSLDVAWYVTALIVVPLTIMWAIGLLEFVGGRQF